MATRTKDAPEHKDFNGVRYEGYDPATERCKFSVPSGWGTAIPYPNARLISAAPELWEACRAALAALEAMEGNGLADYTDNPTAALLRGAVARAPRIEEV